MPLENLIIVGGRSSPDWNFDDHKEGDTRFNLSIWDTSKKPYTFHDVAVPYRGGYNAGDGLNDIRLEGRYLLVADNEGILCYDVNNPNRGYTELGGIVETSWLLSRTSNHLISGGFDTIQVHDLKDIYSYLKNSDFSGNKIDIPYREVLCDTGGNYFSMISFGKTGSEKILLNTTRDESHIIDPYSGETKQVIFRDEDNLFPDTLQRKAIHHFKHMAGHGYSILTEYMKEDQPHEVREYQFHDTPSPWVFKVGKIEFEDRQIISTILDKKKELVLLTDTGSESRLERMDTRTKEILDIQQLPNRYEMGDRLHMVDDDLFIVRHREEDYSSIVDIKTNQEMVLSDAVAELSIPEISSVWEYPQTLYVARKS